MEKKFSIIIIDDDVDMASNLQDILEAEGYDVEAVSYGGAALNLCREKLFDLALVDIKLPDMPGQRLVEELARLSPETEYIMITGHASLESAIESIKQMQIIDYETKPLDIDHLLSFIRQITDRKRAEEELEKHREHLEEMVQKRTAELQSIVNSMAGREVRMAGLKETIRKLRAQVESAGMIPVADDPLKI